MSAATSAVTPEQADRALTPEPGRGLRILVLDDSREDRRLAIQMLQREFSALETVEIADAGTWAAALTAGGFDLVVTDYVMHWTDGIEVLKTLKARYPECPVIMVTGTGNEEVAVAAMKLGLDEYVVKSVLHHRRLPSVVRAVLERRRTAELENRLATLTDEFGVGVYCKTLDGRLLDCNAAFRRLADRWAAGDPALLADRLCSAPGLAAAALHPVLGPQPVYEVPIADPHGEQHWLSVRRVLTSRGADTIIDGFVTDVTTQHQTLEQLRHIEETVGVGAYRMVLPDWCVWWSEGTPAVLDLPRGTMASRAARAGGLLALAARPGGGTTVRVFVPQCTVMPTGPAAPDASIA